MTKLEEREAKASASRRKSFIQTMVTDDTAEENTTKPETEKLIQRSYYLSDDLLRAITIKTGNGSKDKSGVVRDALEIYLADILEEIRSKK